MSHKQVNIDNTYNNDINRDIISMQIFNILRKTRPAFRVIGEITVTIQIINIQCVTILQKNIHFLALQQYWNDVDESPAPQKVMGDSCVTN